MNQSQMKLSTVDLGVCPHDVAVGSTSLHCDHSDQPTNNGGQSMAEQGTVQKLRFAQEKFSDVIIEMLPLLHLQWQENAHFRNIPLEVDTDTYQRLCEAGVLRIFTARKNDELIGYNVYFLMYSIHHKSSFQAIQDVTFIHKKHRGAGIKLIKHSEKQLKEQGVQVIYQHVKHTFNFGNMLERMGYELIDLIYGKELV